MVDSPSHVRFQPATSGTRSPKNGVTSTPVTPRTSLDHLKSNDEGDVGLTQVVGHKADLMLTHYARTFDGLAYAQTLRRQARAA